MKIAIFGASGATGTLLTSRCLAAGHQVTALLRTPENLPSARPGPRRPGQRLRPGSRPPDHRRRRRSPLRPGAHSPFRNENVLARAVPLIVAAMQQTGVRRIIVLGSAGALPTALDKQPAYRRWIVENIINKTLLKWPVAEQVAQYATLSHSDLDWTMVMPPMLTNGPARGSYRIDGEALPRNGSRISRADVADFMMQQLDNPQWVRKGVYLSW